MLELKDIIQYNINGPFSVSQSVIIATVSELYFEIENQELLRKNLLHETRYRELLKSFKDTADRYTIMDFFDKELFQVALRIRRVTIAPGIYKLVEEFVPVDTKAYRDALRKLLLAFKSGTSRYPTCHELMKLKSEALKYGCDIEMRNGRIILNPKKINEVGKKDPSYDRDKDKFSYIFNSQFSETIESWDDYKLSVQSRYGIKWDDDYDDGQNSKGNIWSIAETDYFDNRYGKTLVEQRSARRK